MAALAGIGVTMSGCPGQTIIIEGDPIRHCFGSYRAPCGFTKRSRTVAARVIDFLGAGDCFGLTGLDRHGCTAEAISPSTLIRYSRQTLQAATHADASIAQALFRLACRELEQAQQQMLLLGRKSADEKIASVLLSRAARGERAGRPLPIETVVDLPMSRQDMADYLGLTIETVSRTLTRFRRLGLIDLLGRHQVVLRRIDALGELADGLVGGVPQLDRQASRHAVEAPV